MAVTAPKRPINRPFSSIVPLDVELPLDRHTLGELGVRGLQSGCGDAVRRGWLNSDYRSLHDGADFRTAPGSIYRVAEDRFFLQHEVPDPFPIADESLDWCYAEHFIEHLTPEHGIAWLAEMRRILRPGGFVRVSTPDLRKYARGYLDPSDAFLAAHRRDLTDHFGAANVARPAFMVNQTFYSWGHKWMYDFDELRHAAVAAGFSAEAVVERRFRDSREAEVARLDIPQRENESVYVEIEKS
jgi:predicted SAM-dependent methyltransferase